MHAAGWLAACLTGSLKELSSLEWLAGGARKEDEKRKERVGEARGLLMKPSLVRTSKEERILNSCRRRRRRRR